MIIIDASIIDNTNIVIVKVFLVWLLILEALNLGEGLAYSQLSNVQLSLLLLILISLILLTLLLSMYS